MLPASAMPHGPAQAVQLSRHQFLAYWVLIVGPISIDAKEMVMQVPRAVPGRVRGCPRCGLLPTSNLSPCCSWHLCVYQSRFHVVRQRSTPSTGCCTKCTAKSKLFNHCCTFIMPPFRCPCGSNAGSPNRCRSDWFVLQRNP